MIEVEIKIPITDRAMLARKLVKKGFLPTGFIRESDLYFNQKSNDFRKTDEALRIRTSTDVDTCCTKSMITYKGPKLDQISMTRVECETEVKDAKVVKKILESLGFYAIFPVNKLRHYYSLEDMTACVDQVEGLGDFLELEILVEKDEERRNALEKIKEVLRELGHGIEETTTTSYLSMLEQKDSSVK